jgi:hypothetical protein
LVDAFKAQRVLHQVVGVLFQLPPFVFIGSLPTIARLQLLERTGWVNVELQNAVPVHDPRPTGFVPKLK